MKCDRQFPCGQCKLHGRASECVPVKRTIIEDDNRKRTISNELTARNSNSEGRSGAHYDKVIVNEVENLLTSALEKLQKLPNCEPSAETSYEEGNVEAFSKNKRAKVGTSSSAERAVDNNPSLLSKVEHTVMGFIPKFESKPSIEQQKTTYASETLPDKPLAPPRMDSFDHIASQLLQVLPPDIAVNVVNYYFDSLEWLTRVLDPHVSRTQYLNMALAPVEWILNHEKPSCICCYITVLAIGLHFAPQEYLARWKIDEEVSRSMSKKMFCGCHQMVWSSNFLGSPDIDFLSCATIMSLYPHDEEKTGHMSWAMLGAEVKMAQSLGFHRLDGPRGEPLIHASLSNPVQREIARRIYWYLIWFDWSYSTVSNAYSIQPIQTFTKPPANTDIMETGEVIEKSPWEYSETSYLIFSIRYVEICRQITDTRLVSGGELDIVQTKAFSSALELVHNSVPVCLKYSEDEEELYGISRKRSLVMEKCMLEIMFHNRMLQLHRQHQLEGYHQGQWKFARVVSVRSAIRIVEIVTKFCVAYPELLKYYLIIYYVLGAATTLIMDVCCSTSDSVSDLELSRAAIRGARKLLGSTQGCSNAAHSSRIVVDEFLKAENTIRRSFMEEETMNLLSKASFHNDGPKLKYVFRNILRNAFVEHLKEGGGRIASQSSSSIDFSSNETAGAQKPEVEPGSLNLFEHAWEPHETICPIWDEEDPDILQLLNSVLDV